MNFDFTKIQELDIAFTNKRDPLSRTIRFFEVLDLTHGFSFDKLGKAWKAGSDDEIPSHVFLFVKPVPSRFFAAEMVDRGLETDNSITKNYLADPSQKIICIKRVSQMNAAAIARGKAELYRLKDYELQYGWGQLLSHLGLPYKPSATSAICSGLAAHIYRVACGVDYGPNPSPLDILNSPFGTTFKA